jgi:hypothetical protein
MFYDNASLEHLNNKISDIMEEAQRAEYYTLEPTQDLFENIMHDVKMFIKNKRRIVYGGFAQNELIRAKDPKDAFYKELNRADVEFYSPEPVQDVIELTELLHKKYKNVSGAQAVHENTYKVYAEFINVCDVSYMPRHIYNMLPRIELTYEKGKLPRPVNSGERGLIYTHPMFMYIDMYRVYTDPLGSYYRLDKTYKRSNILCKHYPIREKTGPLRNMNLPKNHKETLMWLFENVCVKLKESIIVHGYFANNYFQHEMKTTKKAEGKTPYKEIINNTYVPFLEVVSVNFEEDMWTIKEKLTEKFGSKLTINEYVPFLEMTGHSIEYVIDGHPYLKLYPNNNRCLARHKHADFNLASFQYTMLMNLINLNRSIINGWKNELYNHEIMSYTLLNNRNEFMKKNNMKVTDKSILQDFKIECIGTMVSQMRLYFTGMKQRAEEKKRVVFRYTPGQGVNLDPTKWFFPNISGNMVMNDRNKILRKRKPSEPEPGSEPEPEPELNPTKAKVKANKIESELDETSMGSGDSSDLPETSYESGASSDESDDLPDTSDDAPDDINNDVPDHQERQGDYDSIEEQMDELLMGQPFN